MKRFRSLFRLGVLLSAIGAMILGMADGAVAASGDADNIHIFWSFVARTGSTDNSTMVPITRDTELKSGDRLQMMVELEKKCFVYLFYKSSGSEIHLLFPYTLDQFDADYQTSVKYFIPKNKTSMYTLNETTGLETFYLLVSENRLGKLERLYTDYEAAEALEKKDAGVREIVGEIRALKKKHGRFKSSAERPVTIGGSVRGDVENYKVEIKAGTFYSRSFTIDHK